MMRQQKRQVTDKATICAMLDEMDTINLGMYDEPFPYVVPLNFGYEWNDELIFYFHCAHEGHKLDLLNRNPRVCVTASRFISYAGASVKGHLHDYRSVIARGVAQRTATNLSTHMKNCLSIISVTRRRCIRPP